MTTFSRIRLGEIAHGRSGDKGDHANVAVIAYTPAGYRWLRDHLTADRVSHYFADLKPSRVVRYEAPNVLALNFLLHDVLAGGASRSLRIDSQGKTLALALLNMWVDIAAGDGEPGASLAAMVRPRTEPKPEEPPKVVQGSDPVCERCGRPMRLRRGRRGEFLGCSGYPECKNTRPLSDPGGGT